MPAPTMPNTDNSSKHPSVFQGEGRGMVTGGACLFRLASGEVALVRGGAPGDVATIALSDRRRGVLTGELQDLLKAGPQRRTIPCPLAIAGCGGCQWQHLQYEAQVQEKQRILNDCLRRIGGITDIPLREALRAPDEWHYRHTMQFAITPNGDLGLRRTQSHDFVPITTCFIAHPLINRILEILAQPLARTILRDHASSIEEMTVRIATKGSIAAALITFWTNSGERRPLRRLARLLMEDCPHVVGVVYSRASRHVFQQQHQTPIDLIAGTDVLEQELSGHVYLIGPTTFFQVNPAQAAWLIQNIRQTILEHHATHVLDLFCGAGLFSIGIADLVESTQGIETSAPAIQLARRSTENADLAHKVTFQQADALRLRATQLAGYDMVIVDPPRSGLSTPLITALSESAVRTLVYISCEPSTLARDIKQLIAAQWQLLQVQIIDLFPQTAHIESLSILSRSPRSSTIPAK